MTTPRLDWVSEHDPRSLQYLSAELVGAPRRRKTIWAPGRILDQGAEGACVAFAMLAEALAAPVRVDFSKVELPAGWPSDPQELAFVVYNWARERDEFPGSKHSGTSVLQGAKALRMLGVISGYRWARGSSEVIDALCGYGPVVLGIPWFDGMYSAPNGELTASGRLVGGHAILAIGYDPTHTFLDGSVGEAVLLCNSWGEDWSSTPEGGAGTAWIRADVLANLLRQRGEACVVIGRSLGRAKARVVLRAMADTVREIWRS